MHMRATEGESERERERERETERERERDRQRVREREGERERARHLLQAVYLQPSLCIFGNDDFSTGLLDPCSFIVSRHFVIRCLIPGRKP